MISAWVHCYWYTDFRRCGSCSRKESHLSVNWSLQYRESVWGGWPYRWDQWMWKNFKEYCGIIFNHGGQCLWVANDDSTVHIKLFTMNMNWVEMYKFCKNNYKLFYKLTDCWFGFSVCNEWINCRLTDPHRPSQSWGTGEFTLFHLLYDKCLCTLIKEMCEGCSGCDLFFLESLVYVQCQDVSGECDPGSQ